MDQVKIVSGGHGYNTIVEVNGEQLTSAKSVKFEVTAPGEANVYIQLIGASVDIQGDANVILEGDSNDES